MLLKTILEKIKEHDNIITDNITDENTTIIQFKPHTYITLYLYDNEIIKKETDIILLDNSTITYGATNNDVTYLKNIKHITINQHIPKNEQINIKTSTSEDNTSKKNNDKECLFQIQDEITRKLDIEIGFEYIPYDITEIKTIPSIQGMIRTTTDPNILYFDIYYRLNGISIPYRVYWEHTIIIETPTPEQLTTEYLLFHPQIGETVDNTIKEQLQDLCLQAPLYTNLLNEIYKNQ